MYYNGIMEFVNSKFGVEGLGLGAGGWGWGLGLGLERWRGCTGINARKLRAYN